MKRKRITHTSIEVTNACNLFCNACKTPHGKNFISVDTFTQLAKSLKGHITGLGLHWRGEPCLHPQLPELAQIARELDLKPWTSTNTAVPNLSKPNYVQKLLDNLDWIEFCVDGYDEATASKYRVGADWNQIKSNLSIIGRTKARCTKKMRVLMFKYNDGKEDIYRNMAKKYGMDEIIFSAPLIGLETIISDTMADEWLSINPKYQRYQKAERGWRRITGKCNPGPIIAVNGVVYACCLDWGLQHPIGNLTNISWSKIVRKYQGMSQQLGNQEMCNRCCLPRRQVNFMEKII